MEEDSFNQISFNLPTSLSKDEYNMMSKLSQKDKTKSFLIIFKEEVILKLHASILEEEEFNETLILFSKNEVKIPDNMNPSLVETIVFYFYCREINDLKINLVFDLMKIAIFFRLGLLIEKILIFLKSNITEGRRAIFTMKHLYPLTFSETPNPNCNFRKVFDQCEMFLVGNNLLKDLFDFISNDILGRNYKIDVEAELLQHIKFLKMYKIDSLEILNLILLFKEKVLQYKTEREAKFDSASYLERLIEDHIDVMKIDQKKLNFYLGRLDLKQKDFEIKVLKEKLAQLETQNALNQGKISELDSTINNLKIDYQSTLQKEISSLKEDFEILNKNFEEKIIEQRANYEAQTTFFLKEQRKEFEEKFLKERKNFDQNLLEIKTEFSSLKAGLNRIQEDKSKIQVKSEPFKLKNIEEVKAQEPSKSIDNPSLPQKSQKFKFLTELSDLQFLASLFQIDSLERFTSQLTLLYRASDNKFKGKKFHRLCDNKGPVLMVIRSGFKKLFGGYLNASVLSNEKYINAPDSFLFSISHRTKHALIEGKEEKTFFGSAFGWGPVFGDGPDLRLSNKCDRKKTNQCNLGGSYSLPKNMVFNSNEARAYLGGGVEFEVEDYEVFKWEKI